MCEIKFTRRNNLFSHFKKKHSNDIKYADNQFNRSYFLFYFKHLDKELFVGKLFTIQ